MQPTHRARRARGAAAHVQAERREDAERVQREEQQVAILRVAVLLQLRALVVVQRVRLALAQGHEHSERGERGRPWGRLTVEY